MKVRKLIKSKSNEIVKVSKKHGAKTIRLFGSVARGEERENSDVDFLVEMAKGSTVLDVIAIKQDLEDMLKIKVDVVTVYSISPYIREEILKEAVNL